MHICKYCTKTFTTFGTFGTFLAISAHLFAYIKKKQYFCSGIGRLYKNKEEESRLHHYNKKTIKKYLHILDATYAGNLAVKLVFSDKHVSVVNVGDWVRQHPHPQYNRFLDEAKFRKFYLDDMGNVAWGKNRDLYFPIEQLYNGMIN